MASFVNAKDAVVAAVEIEKRGYEFYCRVRDHATTQDDKDFFNFMAEEEKRHEGIFEALLARLGDIPMPAGASDDEYLLYIHALLDSHSLFMPGQQEKTLQDPYHMAIQFEKDTLLFFVALEPMVPASEAMHVKFCADEERKHIQMLAKRARLAKA